MAQITRKKKRPTRRITVRLWLALVFTVLLVYLSLSGKFITNNQEFTGRHDAKEEWTARVAGNNNLLVRPEEALDHPEYVYPRRCSLENTTIASVLACYPDAPLQPPRNGEHNNIHQQVCDMQQLLKSNFPLTWSDIQQCFVGTRRNSKNSSNNNQKNNSPSLPVTEIHVIGERNSGTKWLQQEISKCFPKKDTAIRCHRDFLRSKHFFQPPVLGDYGRSLVIAIVRDPLEWFAAMREKPYHMPYHTKGFDMSQKQQPAIPLDWETFLQRAAPWTMPGLSSHDQQYLLDLQSGKLSQTDFRHCVQGFSFDEVTPCIFDNSTVPRSKWRGHMPVYELQRDRSGQPFDDLLKLRSDKIRNFVLEVPLLMNLGGYSAVRYEDLLQHGTRTFLEQIAKMMGMPSLPPACRPQEPHPERIGHRSASIPPNVRQWVEDRLVLETEQLLGYR